MTNQKPLKRAIIKEELVKLTGDFLSAVIINQFIYWSERVRDYDQMLKEEKERLQILGENNNDKYEFKNGWIFKTASELNQEIMTGKSDATIRRRIDDLIENEWIKKRRNPRNKQDRTYQYRVDIIKIQKDLLKLGYSLDKYPLLVDEISNLQNAVSNLHDEDSNLQNAVSSLHSAGTVPEITTEIINNNKNNKKSDFQKIKNSFKKSFATNPNSFQLEKIKEHMISGLSKQLILKTIEHCGLGGHNQSFFFNRLSMLVEDEIYTVDQLNSVLSQSKTFKNNSSSSEKDSQNKQQQSKDSNYKWKDFFIDFDKYKE